jgi:hypothetical protein
MTKSSKKNRRQRATTKSSSSKRGIPHFLILGTLLYVLFLGLGWYLSADVKEGIVIFINNQIGTF